MPGGPTAGWSSDNALKHGSWLSTAQIEFSMLSGCCLEQKSPDETVLRREASAQVPVHSVAQT